ncbi:MAG: RAD55 family ATPase [Candidatus Nanohaloarchaea archaeon]
MAEDRERVSTGDEVLDKALRGGLPSRRSVLLTGGPGAGKTTAGMSFLQEGLEKGESCLMVSTEQSEEELRDSFRQFDIDLDHDNLEIATVAATPGETLDGDDDILTLGTLGGEDDTVSVPFESHYIKEYLRDYIPVDRVLVDSMSAFRLIGESAADFRRVALEMIQFFTGEAGATSVFTSEKKYSEGEGDVLEYDFHGVLSLERETVEGDEQRFITVRKMRGVDHDTRRFHLSIDGSGIDVGPSRRSQPPALKSHSHEPIGIEGLDSMTGGGLIKGSPLVLESRGQANMKAFYSIIVQRAVENGYQLVISPTREMDRDNLNRMLNPTDYTVEDLFEEERLEVVDMVGLWSKAEGVYHPGGEVEALKKAYSAAERSERPVQLMLNVSAAAHRLGPSNARSLAYHESGMVEEEDRLIYLMNPRVIPDELADTYIDMSDQVLTTWLADDGIQWIKLKKSPCGYVGKTALVEYMDERPYLSVEAPPSERENPLAED